jgi:uncharacterized protein (TIGR02118 family)
MYKLIILIETPEDTFEFDSTWPQFLHEAERMPGLIREATVRVVNTLFGGHDIYMIHELFFETQGDLQAAMASPQGQVSGHILQRITNGRMALLVAEHKQDEIENIKRYQVEEKNADTS